jgi:hypothetical protein
MAERERDPADGSGQAGLAHWTPGLLGNRRERQALFYFVAMLMVDPCARAQRGASPGPKPSSFSL